MNMETNRDAAVREEGERIKIERNSKGYNYSYSVIRKANQSWDDVLAELREVEGKLAQEYGRG